MSKTKLLTTKRTRALRDRYQEVARILEGLTDAEKLRILQALGRDVTNFGSLNGQASVDAVTIPDTIVRVKVGHIRLNIVQAINGLLYVGSGRWRFARELLDGAALRHPGL